jgi:hypothetical protein
VRNLARCGNSALLCVVLGLLWVAAVTPIQAAARVVNLSAEVKDGTYRASFQLADAFTQEILDTIASGLPLTFEYRVEVFQRRTMWPDLVHLQQLVRVSVDFDSLTRQYSLRREVDGQVVDSLSTEKPEEMRTWMTSLADVDVGAFPETLQTTGREQFRVKCRMASGFVFFFFPHAVETRWAKVPLPVEVPAPAEAEKEVP